jgi:N-acetylglucosaminyldiphosphoundecaprenol N-acetyl-beta-D-mannosaminyltransferase
MIKEKKLAGVRLQGSSKNYILEKIKKYVKNPDGFFHIVSLNPENIVVAQENEEFKKALNNAQIGIFDGVGVVLAARILGVSSVERVTGVDLMEELVKLADKLRLRVLLIGGRGNLAKSLADCYQKNYRKAEFFGLEGIKEIKNLKKTEEEEIFAIVSRFKPHLVFVAFGSPSQELWIECHKEKFSKMVVMGVGGAFDFLAGQVPRAPRWVRRIGLEWLFRLLAQPWRWRRQTRLLRFVWLVIKEKFFSKAK